MANNIAIKGKYNDNGTIRTVTIATLSGLNIGGDGEVSFDNVEIAARTIAANVQPCVSATVTGFTISYDGNDGESYGTPGDTLESAEIFSEDFSDTEVVPTLQIQNANARGDSKTFSFKYMADPVDTQNFNQKVTTLAESIGELYFGSGGQYDEFTQGDMRFTAKDTVARPD